MSNSKYGRNFGFKQSTFGSDTKGHKVKAYGNTTGKYVEWDEVNNKLKVSGSIELISDTERVMKIAKVALGAADTGGGVLSWANPESSSIIVTRIILDVTTKATGACTLDVGTTATNATTSSDNLLDGVDVGAAAGVFDNVEDQGTNGTSRQKLASGKWITASKASGAAAGLVGFAYIHYIVV